MNNIYASEEHDYTELDEAELAHQDAEQELAEELSREHADENNIPIHEG